MIVTVFSIGPDGLVEQQQVPGVPPGGGMALSPDGSLLMIGGLAATAVLLDASTFGLRSQVTTWNLDPSTWVAQACELVGRNLTRAEWDTYVGGEYTVTCDQWPAGT